jgi:hypothetical protein
MKDLDAEIAQLDKDAREGKLFKPEEPPPEPGAVPPPQPGQPQAPASWQPNPERIEKIAGPAGNLWAFAWDKVAEIMGLPEAIEIHDGKQAQRIECRVSNAERQMAGENLAKLIDAILPQWVSLEPQSRAGTIFACLGMIAFLAIAKVKGLSNARELLEQMKRAEQEGTIRGPE